MTILSDSDAEFDPTKIYSQHQAAIILLQGLLSEPDCHEIKWLDLACGKGQIISQIGSNLPEEFLKKIEFTAYDIKVQHLQHVERQVDSHPFKKFKPQVGDIDDFHKLIDEDMKFDFATLTNALHEISPCSIGALLYELMIRISQNGLIFIYDMANLPDSKPELGAVPWIAEDISKIVKVIFETIGFREYYPIPSSWIHKTCKAWSLQISLRHFKNINSLLCKNKKSIIENVRKVIEEIIDDKYIKIKMRLDSYTRKGTGTAEEIANRLPSLYEFWALSRAKEAF